MKGKEADGDKLMKKVQKLTQPSLIGFRLKPDWESACPLAEQAVNAYKQAKVPEKTRIAHERAAMCQEKSGSSWHAARHMESAGALAVELDEIDAAIDLYTQAANLFFECGRPQAGAVALSNGAKVLSFVNKAQASKMFSRAIETMCDSDERATSAPDIFRQAIAHEVKNEEWELAVGLLLKLGLFCEEKKLSTTQNRSYLSAVVLWLHAGNGVQALATFRDCSSIDSFYMAEEGRAAQRLIDAYKGSNPDDIKQVIKNNSCFQFLDACIGRLAMKLPREDVDKIASDMQNEGEGIQGGDVDDDDDELL